MKNHKLCIIACYFGKLPWYFPLFIKSCRSNPFIDFLILIDDKNYVNSESDNIFIRYIDLLQFSHLATQKIGLPIKVDSGYKLCDFKPAYGLIFQDYIEKYGFWGHFDIDIIFGDIKGFITDELLTNYDLISVRHDWLTGCFLIFRNNNTMNNLFKRSKDYKMIYSNNINYCFDETGFLHDEFSSGKYYKDIIGNIESMMHVVKKYEEIGEIKPYFDQFIVEGLPGSIRWHSGRLFFKKYEILLYHMIHFKNKFKPQKEIETNIENFNISKNKIYYRGKITSTK